MKITYLGTIPKITIPDVGTVERGDTIEVKKEIGEKLIKQNPHAWKGSFRDRLVTKEEKKKVTKDKNGGKG